MLKNLLKGKLIKNMIEQNKTKESGNHFNEGDKKETSNSSNKEDETSNSSNKGDKNETSNSSNEKDKKEIPHSFTSSNTKAKKKEYNESEILSENDFIKCLLQQTTSYQRGDKILVATGKEEELFLVYYFDNTFYIVKVAFVNGKLNVVYDYRRKSFLLEEFEYRIKEGEVTSRLKLANSEVEFTVKPKITYQGDCEIIRNQTSQYKEFVVYLDTYRENINSCAMERRNEKGYRELILGITKISIPDRKAILTLIEEGNKNEAIKKIQEKTGLGLADCAKIADKPYMYL